MAGQPIVPTANGGDDILFAGKALVTVPTPTVPSSAVTKAYADSLTTGGPSSPTYVHNQASPATTWTINHNLGFRPDVAVFNSGSININAEVQHPTVNQAVVVLTIATAGFARLT